MTVLSQKTLGGVAGELLIAFDEQVGMHQFYAK